MDFVLLGIIIVLFAYIVYKDYSFGNERERMYLKLMSRTAQEYKEVTSEEIIEGEREEPPVIIPIEEATVEEILKADDIT